MSYEEEIFRFLSAPDNLKLALEIEGHLRDVKSKLEQKFWKELYSILKEKFEENVELSTSCVWELIEPNWENYRNNWFGICLYPKNLKNGQRFFGIYIEIEGKRLYGGIHCARRGVKGVKEPLMDLLNKIPELKKLQDQLKVKDFKSSNEGSVSWKWFDNQLLINPENLLSLAREKEYSALMAENVWALFLENKNELEKINNIILKTDENQKI